jgi:phosphocarrier protein FPr
MWIKPDDRVRDRITTEMQTWKTKQSRLRDSAQKPAATQDGHTIQIAANIGSPTDARTALTYGAEGIGLFRTEFLFMDRTEAPSEDEQVTAYKDAAREMGDHPVIVRTLDIGGDKPLSYIDFGQEDNPFLGWRGIRFSLAEDALFRTQLRAILRAGADHPIKVMFPMVSTLDELRAARAVLKDVQADLKSKGISHAESISVGVMIEVPSSAMMADVLTREVDFFSIGTNDLTQYTMAADRGNARTKALVDPFDPAVLRMIQRTVDAAHQASIKAYMCGEFAANPLATPLLVGIGLDELSMSTVSIPAIKDRIRGLTLDRCKTIHDKVMAMESAAKVRAYLESTPR